MAAFFAVWVSTSVPIAMIVGSAIAFGMGGDENLDETIPSSAALTRRRRSSPRR